MNIKTNFAPYPKQMDVLNGILNDPAKYHVLVSGRQVGKTLLAINLLLSYAITTQGSYNVLVSPVFAQSKKCFEDLADAGGGGNPLVVSINRSDLIMKFWNGSIIRMVSGESDQNLRGFTTSGILILDEAAYVAEYLWTEILRPTTMIRCKKVLFISTPCGDNWFKKIYEFGQDPELPEWKSYRITAQDNPYLAPSELIAAQKTLPDKVYQQEYLGVFLDGSGSVFDFEDCAVLDYFRNQPDWTKKYYGGLDLAMENDYTVLTIMDEEGTIVDIFRERRTSWEQVISEVAKRIKKWKAKTFVEFNGPGGMPLEKLTQLCGSSLIKKWVTTQDSKMEIIQSLKYGFANQELRIPKKDSFPALHQELSTFTYKMLPTGKIKYEAAGGMHDDCVMSLAFAWESKKQGNKKGIYHTIGRNTFNPYA